MLTLREAVKTAVTTFEDLFPENASDLRLEEIDHADPNDIWKITLLITNPDFDKELESQRGLSPAARFLGAGATIPSRKYKSIVLNSNNGELVSIKNA